MIDETTPLPIDAPSHPSPAPARSWTTLPAKRRLARRSSSPLFTSDAADSLRTRWLDIQTSFVDEPGRSVEEADLLVAEVMRQLARTFAEKRSKLEPQLVKGEDISTEDLRIALRHYRSFFDRLLSV
jgi:pyruvate/oxaloacetate carboxyltransferase